MRVLKWLIFCLLLAVPAVAQTNLEPPVQGEFDPDSVEGIDLNDYPVLPEVTEHAREIYAKAEGQNLNVFAKVGDCMTANPYFMSPFSGEDYDLGEYSELQDVIDYFSEAPVADDANSFSNVSMASASGFNTAGVLDPIWADPAVCSADESPLACEYRLLKPGFSVIMFGTNDVFSLEPSDFDYYLRLIVLETVENNIVPVMSTFPTRLEDPERAELFNKIVVKIAEDYDLPLINLFAAVSPLPNEGIDAADPTHLSIPEDERTGDFTSLDYGYTWRNLVTLQALDILWRGLEVEE
jgi:hypothetical protein